MVQYVPDKTGRFAQRPHYKPQELDRECENIISSFLRSRYGKAEFPVSTDDITRLIEQDADDLDLYADLSEFGPDVEGVTEFRLGKKPLVKIASHFSEDERRENRLRTTLTHEYGHVRFHAYLWEIELPQRDFLKKNPNANKQICKRDDILNAAQYDWMEWQAGYACGALLMPITHVVSNGEWRSHSTLAASKTPSSLGCDARHSWTPYRASIGAANGGVIRPFLDQGWTSFVVRGYRQASVVPSGIVASLMLNSKRSDNP